MPELPDRAVAAVDNLAAVFPDDGPYDPALTHAAATGVNTLASYLRICLGPARPVALPTTVDLADLILTLHLATTALARGLTSALSDTDPGRRPALSADVDTFRVAAPPVAHARDSLLRAAAGFLNAHQALTRGQ